MKWLLLAASCVFALSGCESERPNTTTDGLNAPCDAGCAPGHDCVSYAAPGGPQSSCQIRCSDDDECPKGYKCNVPPILPDSIVNVCAK